MLSGTHGFPGTCGPAVAGKVSRFPHGAGLIVGKSATVTVPRR
jgi:hypothetical protein